MQGFGPVTTGGCTAHEEELDRKVSAKFGVEKDIIFCDLLGSCQDILMDVYKSRDNLPDVLPGRGQEVVRFRLDDGSIVAYGLRAMVAVHAPIQ